MTSAELHTALAQHFGHHAFRPKQEEIVAALCGGNSAFALLPTGAGKSLCYQLPAILRQQGGHGTTLVISPLIALMQDQVQALKKRGVVAERLDSTLSKEEAAAVLRRFAAGELTLLYIAPERLLNPTFARILPTVKIGLVAIDEAHCISEWGHNFRPDYLRIAKVVADLALGPVLALTATATPQTAEAIRQSFAISPENVFQTSFLRQNLHLHVTPLTAEKRLGRVLALLKPKEARPAIVYVTLQETSEWLATQLAARKLKARAYHAGLADEHRSEAQEAFMAGKCDVIVATIAFGMGIDKANVRSVLHYNLPKTLENYQQETGRGGRDGLPAHCELLACGDDQTVLENFVHGDRPTDSSVRMLLDFLLRQGSSVELSSWQAAGIYDIRPGVLETILTVLELAGILEFEERFYDAWEVKLLRPLDAVLAGRELAERLFIQQVWAKGEERGHLRKLLELTSIAAQLEKSPTEIQGLLEGLQGSNDAALRPYRPRQRYRVRTRESVAALLSQLELRFNQQEEHDIARIQQLVDFALASGCRTQRLLAYFGEALPQPCGSCDLCQQKASTLPELPTSERRQLTVDDVARIQRMCDEKHPALRSPRALARFLCGIASPAAAREKLQKHELFGSLAKVPFRDVLGQILA
jgi:ATP-dependent DNA helicase RecQ